MRLVCQDASCFAGPLVDSAFEREGCPFTEMAAPAAAPPWLNDADLAAQKYTEAVVVAVEKCADDTKGQTCYICTEALHWKTKEGLVRGCACRGTSGTKTSANK